MCTKTNGVYRTLRKKRVKESNSLKSYFYDKKERKEAL